MVNIRNYNYAVQISFCPQSINMADSSIEMMFGKRIPETYMR